MSLVIVAFGMQSYGIFLHSYRLQNPLLWNRVTAEYVMLLSRVQTDTFCCKTPLERDAPFPYLLMVPQLPETYPFSCGLPPKLLVPELKTMLNAQTIKATRSVHLLTNTHADAEERSEILALMRFTKRGMCAFEISEANFLSIQKAMSHLQELATSGNIVRVVRDGMLLHELA